MFTKGLVTFSKDYQLKIIIADMYECCSLRRIKSPAGGAALLFRSSDYGRAWALIISKASRADVIS